MINFLNILLLPSPLINQFLTFYLTPPAIIKRGRSYLPQTINSQVEFFNHTFSKHSDYMIHINHNIE